MRVPGVAQKNILYFLEPTTQRGVPNARVNSEPMVSRVCVVASQNTVEPNRALIRGAQIIVNFAGEKPQQKHQTKLTRSAELESKGI